MNDEAAPCALIVMGVSGSGKTTVAKALAGRLHWVYEDGDAFHPKSNVEKMRSGQPLTDADREPWLRAIAVRINRARGADEHLVIACSALKRAYRDILASHQSDVQFVFLDGSRALLAERLATRRNHFMPPGLLDSQLATLERPHADECATTVSIDATPEAMVTTIVDELGLSAEKGR